MKIMLIGTTIDQMILNLECEVEAIKRVIIKPTRKELRQFTPLLSSEDILWNKKLLNINCHKVTLMKKLIKRLKGKWVNYIRDIK